MIGQLEEQQSWNICNHIQEYIKGQLCVVWYVLKPVYRKNILLLNVICVVMLLQLRWAHHFLIFLLNHTRTNFNVNLTPRKRASWDANICSVRQGIWHMLRKLNLILIHQFCEVSLYLKSQTIYNRTRIPENCHSSNFVSWSTISTFQ